MLNTNEQWSDKQSHITELKIWKKCDPKIKNESAQNCKIVNITVLLQCCKWRVGVRCRKRMQMPYTLSYRLFLYRRAEHCTSGGIILRRIVVVRFRASSSALNKVHSAIWRLGILHRKCHVFLLRYRLKHVSENYLSHISPTFFWQTATPVIVDWFAGRKRKNNNNWYT